MAALLETNVRLAADVLRAGEQDSPSQAMRAIAATRSLDMIVQDTLRALVAQARAAGHTWAEIGELLHTSRQAAFQRFGASSTDTTTGTTPGTAAVPVDGAVDVAVAVLEAFVGSRFEELRATFAKRMLDACSVELLADVREKAHAYGGEVQALGEPVVSVRDGYTCVDVPVALERADGFGRVVIDADRQVVGFFVRPAAQAP